MCILHASQNWYIFTVGQFLINIEHMFDRVKHLNTMYILSDYIFMYYKIEAVVSHLSV